jgi:hypothetical protein
MARQLHDAFCEQALFVSKRFLQASAFRQQAFYQSG